MLLTVNKVNEVLSGTIGNEKYSLPYNSELHQRLITLETKFDEANTIEEAKSIIASAQEVIDGGVEEAVLQAYGEYLKYNSKSQEFFLHSNGVTSSVALPKKLAEYIVEASDKDMPTLPYIKAWAWFLKNPKFSRKKANMFAKYITTTYVDKEKRAKLMEEEGYTFEKASELATYNDLSITKNGLLSTYKYASVVFKKFDKVSGEEVDRYEVTYDEETGIATVKLPDNAEDYTLMPPIMGNSGDAFYSGDQLGHRIRVGQVHELPSWDMVNCEDGTFARPGLHLGGQAYIEGYGGNGRLLLNCFVNPMHIGAFTDTGDGAIRVKEYFVHSAQFAAARAKYNESSYLERSNEQWKVMLSEAIAESEEKIKKINAKSAELQAL